MNQYRDLIQLMLTDPDEFRRREQTDPNFRQRLDEWDADAKQASQRERWDRRAAAIRAVGLREQMDRAIVRGEPMRDTTALVATKRWLASPGVPPILILSGGAGSGKTVAAAWAMADRERGVWFRAQELVRVFAAKWGDEVTQQRKALESGLVVVDDVGTEGDSGAMTGVLVEMVDRRQYSARRQRTILTTNLSRSAWMQRYDNARLVSRMTPTFGAVAWVGCKEDDQRVLMGIPEAAE